MLHRRSFGSALGSGHSIELTGHSFCTLSDLAVILTLGTLERCVGEVGGEDALLTVLAGGANLGLGHHPAQAAAQGIKRHWHGAKLADNVVGQVDIKQCRFEPA